MKVNFRQGLVSSEVDGNKNPSFLVNNSSGITLRASNRPIVFTVANGQKDYTIDYYKDVLAWPKSMFTDIDECWLYIDINRATAARTYGVTMAAPTYGPTAPSGAITGQMWFDTKNNTMKVFNTPSNVWIASIRVIAGRYTRTSIFIVPFGSQVGITGGVYNTGTILTDGFGVAVTDSRKQFITTEDTILVNGAPSYAAKLESNITVASAAQPIAAFSVVKMLDNGTVVPADYDDVGTCVLGLTTVAADVTEPVSLVLTGKVHNPLWNWGSANVTLWVDESGELVAVDPFTTDPPRLNQQVPVARSIDAQTIIFDQGLGGVGPQGKPGKNAEVATASDTVLGIARLSVAPDSAATPIAVGINDPILTSPKVPLFHTHPATEVTAAPFGAFTTGNVQQALAYLENSKLSKTGGTVTGNIITQVQATADSHLISLGQVKSINADLANTYKQLQANSSMSLVNGFNAIDSASRTIAVNAIVSVVHSSTVYLWTGGPGSPAVATSTGQFIKIGEIDTAAQFTIRATTAYAAYIDTL